MTSQASVSHVDNDGFEVNDPKIIYLNKDNEGPCLLGISVVF